MICGAILVAAELIAKTIGGVRSIAVDTDIDRNAVASRAQQVLDAVPNGWRS